MEANKYPLDFDQLKKGEVLTPDITSKVLGLNHLTSQSTWRLALLKLAGEIEARTGICVRCIQNNLHLLTDLEADTWTMQRAAFNVRNLIRNTGRRARINRETFTSEQKRAAESRDRIVSVTALAAEKAFREQQSLEGDSAVSAAELLVEAKS